MKKIRVHTPFTFNNADYSKTNYAVGEHNVKNEVADHWFTQRHAEILDKSAASGDSDEALDVAYSTIEALKGQVQTLTAENTDLKAQVSAAATGLAERNETIADLTNQVTELTEKVNGAKK